MSQVGESARVGIGQIVEEVVRLLRLPDVDVAWSTYDDPDEAIGELEALAAGVARGEAAALERLRFLFLPTADLQEISISSGWGEHYLELAARFDKLSPSYGRCSRVTEVAPLRLAKSSDESLKVLSADGNRTSLIANHNLEFAWAPEPR